jgi:hypothetical protein
MSDGIIVQSIPLSAQVNAVSSTAGVNPAFPTQNIFDPQPKTVMQTNVQASGSFFYQIDFDFGVDRSIDVIAVLFCNASAAAGFQLNSATFAQGIGLLATGNFVSETFGVTPTVNTTRRHALWAGTARIMRYLRIIITEPAGAANRTIRIGNLVVGARLPLAFNFEPGSGRKMEDQSIIRSLPAGETAIERGGRTPLFRATWSNIYDAEMRSLWSLLNDVGTSAPLLIVEDPDATAGQNERIHYGLLTGLDFTERSQEDKQRIDLTIREMI